MGKPKVSIKPVLNLLVFIPENSFLSLRQITKKYLPKKDFVLETEIIFKRRLITLF